MITVCKYFASVNFLMCVGVKRCEKSERKAHIYRLNRCKIEVGSVDNHFHKMDTPIQAGPTGYTDGFGRRVDEDDVEKWFTYGVKPAGKETEVGICSKKTTLYVLAIAVFLVVLGIVIIVPVAVGNAQKSQG